MNLRTSLLLLVSLAVAAPATAQVRIFSGPSGGASSALRLAERALRMKDELKLTSEQVSQLEAIRKEEIAREQELSSRVIELQSEMRAGKLEWEQARDSLEARDEARDDASRAARDRARKVLTDEQRDQIEEEWYGFGTTVRPGRAMPDAVRPRGRMPMEYYIPRGDARTGRRFFRFDDSPDGAFDFNFEFPHMENFEFPHMENFEFPKWENFEFPRMENIEFPRWENFEFPQMQHFQLPTLPSLPPLPYLPSLPALPALPRGDWQYWHAPSQLFDYSWDTKGNRTGYRKLQRRGIL